MSGNPNSNFNASNSNLLDSSGRPFSSQFSAQSAMNPVFHHSGTLQGLHNIHGNFNVQSMSGSLASRNTGISGVPSNGVQQPAGNLPSGRFASNNIPIAMSQMSPSNSHGYSGVTNRGGLSISPILGNASPRITSSLGNIVGGGSNVGRTLGVGGGMGVPGLASRLNISGTSGSGNLGVQSQNRLMSGMLQQVPQSIPMPGSAYHTSGGSLTPAQVQVQGNNSLSSMGVFSDQNANDPLDLNEFPHLAGRPSSAGGPPGQLSSLRKPGGVSSLVQPNQEFSIQNEDFPALPGMKGNNSDFTSMDVYQKEQLHDNTVSLQNQQFQVPRSTGFTLRSTYSSGLRQQQMQQHPSNVSGSGGVSYQGGNSQDHHNLHGGSDLYSSPFHRQTNGPPGIGLRAYDQYAQQLQQVAQFRSQQHLPASASQNYRDHNLKSIQNSTSQSTPPDKYGLLELTNVLKANNDLSSLTNIDLTMLGLNLNSTGNLHKSFASPWADGPVKGEPEYVVPDCYYANPPPAVHSGHFSRFRLEVLFYIFYSMPRDEAQLFAAFELCNRGWFYHKELRQWLIRPQNMEPMAKTTSCEQGTYHYFDLNTWEIHLKENFVVYYDKVEQRPTISQSLVLRYDQVGKKPVIPQLA